MWTRGLAGMARMERSACCRQPSPLPHARKQGTQPAPRTSPLYAGRAAGTPQHSKQRATCLVGSRCRKGSNRRRRGWSRGLRGGGGEGGGTAVRVLACSKQQGAAVLHLPRLRRKQQQLAWQPPLPERPPAPAPQPATSPCDNVGHGNTTDTSPSPSPVPPPPPPRPPPPRRPAPGRHRDGRGGGGGGAPAGGSGPPPAPPPPPPPGPHP